SPTGMVFRDRRAFEYSRLTEDVWPTAYWAYVRNAAMRVDVAPGLEFMISDIEHQKGGLIVFWRDDATLYVIPLDNEHVLPLLALADPFVRIRTRTESADQSAGPVATESLYRDLYLPYVHAPHTFHIDMDYIDKLSDKTLLTSTSVERACAKIDELPDA